MANIKFIAPFAQSPYRRAAVLVCVPDVEIVGYILRGGTRPSPINHELLDAAISVNAYYDREYETFYCMA